MINTSFKQDWLVYPLVGLVLAIGLPLSQVVSAANINISVVDQNGAAVQGFRYLVEEDATIQPDLNQPSAGFDSLSFEFHNSHSPVVFEGTSDAITDSTVSIVVPGNTNYFVSVVPYVGHALGGVAVEVGEDPVDKTVVVNSFPIPTAQISVRVFEDNSPVNGAIDLGERGLEYSVIDGQKQYFDVKLFEPAGQYGAAGGRVIQDAYGNPLGTEYNNAGTVTFSPPNGFNLKPDANGYLVIKHLPPAKYGVEITPPARAGDGGQPIWFQTSTIEGTRTIDAWVKANEPEVFVEFGPPGPHVFVGFVRAYDCMNDEPGYVLNGLNACQDLDDDGNIVTEPVVALGASITGQIVDNHMSRPGPDINNGGSFNFANGTPFEGCRVAINHGIAGRTIYSNKCDLLPDDVPASFDIENLAPGSYSLSIWDNGLDAVIANHPFNVAENPDAAEGGYVITSLLNPAQLGTGGQSIFCGGVTGDATCDFGQIPIFNWNHKIETKAFYDANENGYRDAGEVAIFAEATATNLRFRDGRIYKSVAVDLAGEAPHEEVFPFFHWLVAEVDFAKFKATGATMTVDAGGPDDGFSDLQENGYVEQVQSVPACDGDIDPATGMDTADLGEGCSHDGGRTRTETGAVLTQAFQGFLGQTNTIEFGKTNYAEGENGGISGMAIYAITRAEDDPRYAAAEEWEPGIPRVQIALYEDNLNESGAAAPMGDEIIDDYNGNGSIDHADVDNYPLNDLDLPPYGNFPGEEDFDRNEDGILDAGFGGTEDIDNGVAGQFDMGDAIEVTWTDSWDDNAPTNCGGANNLAGLDDNKCFDGLRNWNQIRPGVFDGGYAFSENLPTGHYIVQSSTPPGYTPLREQDKNVDYGDEYGVPQLLPPICVGASHVIPALVSHVTDELDVQIPGMPADAAPYAGDSRPLCDTKHVRVADGANVAADFHYFTEVPKAAHVVGGVINDVANEFNPLSPTFGEKFSPPWLPVAFYDYNGHEVTRVYTDQFGKYNAMLPSSNTVNIGSPSGVAPNMLTACMNDSGLVDDPLNPGTLVTDPQHNPQYSQFCYTFQYMPGATTYLDTPVVSIAAFAGSGLQLDCDAADTTPLIASVSSNEYSSGAYVSNPLTGTLTIESVGERSVPNPSATELSTSKNVVRDYGFGPDVPGNEVILYDGNGVPNTTTITSWTDSVVTVEVPDDANGRYQLVVINGTSGLSSPMGVTVTVGSLAGFGEVIEVFPSGIAGATPIQDALDYSASKPFGSGRNDLILVAPGTYDEMVIMYQPVALQGAGAYSTVINARSVPAEKIDNWRAKIDELLTAPSRFDLIPGQEVGELFATEAGSGILVVGKSFGLTRFRWFRHSRIDGFSVTGGSTGGGVFLNGYVEGLTISNNLIAGNNGTYGGGIRLGHNTIKQERNGDLLHPDARNYRVKIRNNMITRNGVFNGAGGGIALYTGSNNYRVEDNLVCGNFALTDGAGIGHLGKSSGGQINGNQVIFNQSFRQTPGMETDGGGILIAGADSFNIGGLTAGAGHVQINKNLIQGNQAGAGDGAGIALRRVNGDDIERRARRPGQWWHVRVHNNTIVNNVAGYGGGAISMLEAVRVDILNNTIANNESTATAGAAFVGGVTDPVNGVLSSAGQVAGILSRPHSADGILNVISPNGSSNIARYGQGFSRALIRNNIIWKNRSRVYEVAENLLINPPYATGGGGATDPVYSDLSPGLIVTTPGSLGLFRSNLLTIDYAGDHNSNIPNSTSYTSALPDFISEYVNGSPGINPSPAEFKTIEVAPALDEGGNWLDVRYAPLSINDIDSTDAIDGTRSNYHLETTSDAINSTGFGNRPNGNTDIDGDFRAGTNDIGSDEVE